MRKKPVLPAAWLLTWFLGSGAGLLTPTDLKADSVPAADSRPPGKTGESGASADTLKITLDSAIEHALAARPGVLAAARRVRAAEALHRQAGAWGNPELGIEAEGFGGDRPGMDEAELTLGIEGELDPLGRSGARAEARAEVEVERARRSAVHRVLAAEVRRAYHDVLADRERVGMASRILDLAADTRDAVRREVDAGKLPRIRSLQADAAWESARARHDAAALRHRGSRSRLAALVSRPGKTQPTVATGTLRTPGAVPETAALRETIETDHPELAVARWTAEARDRGTRRARLERWPALGYSLGYRHSRADELTDWVGGLSIELPLLDRRSGAVEAARSLAEAAREEIRDAALDLEIRLDRDLAALHAAAGVLERYDRDVLPAVREAFRLARLGHSEGKFGYLDLVDAERSLVRAEAERTEALIAHDLALTELEALTGRTLTGSGTGN